MEISVRAIPPPGNLHRRRAGRPWAAEAIVVKVVDNPKPHKVDAKGKIEAYSDEISPAQYAELQADPHINAYPVGDPNAAPVLEGKNALVKMQAELEAARKELAGLVEVQEQERARVGKELEDLGRQVAERDAEIDRLRVQVSKKHKA